MDVTKYSKNYSSLKKSENVCLSFSATISKRIIPLILCANITSSLSAELMSSVISSNDGGSGRTFNEDFFLNIIYERTCRNVYHLTANQNILLKSKDFALEFSYVSTNALVIN